MKKNIKLMLLVVLALSTVGICFAQNEQTYTREELLQQIAAEKQQIKQAAKELIIDTLPGLIESDPQTADQALAKASGMLNTMDQNDLVYLLGHLYARMGDDTKAIKNFTSLLKTNLNDDARKMLNLVLYDQMIKSLQNNDRQKAKDFLQAIIFENFNIDRFYPSYLYIWADMSAEDGEYESVSSMLENYNQNRDQIMNVLLPRKKAVISRVNNLYFNDFYRNPTQAEYDKLSSQIESIKVDLTSVYNELISLKGIIYLDAVVKLHQDEMDMLDELKTNLTDFMNSTKDTDKIISEGTQRLQAIKQYSVVCQKQLDLLDSILQKEYERILADDPEYTGTNYSDMELKRLIELDKNLDQCDAIIAELDKAIADPELAPENDQLKAMRADWSEKRSDYQIRKDTYLQTRKHTSDLEESIFNDILMDYYATKQDKKDFELQVKELEDFFANDARQIFDVQKREDLKAVLGTDTAIVANSDERDEVIRKNAREILTNIEFIQLQLAYRNLRYKDQARIAQSGTLSEAEMISKQAEILGEKRELIARIQDYLAQHPDFKAIEQPDSTYLVTAADLYYNLAELQYAVNLNDPAPALASYRKVLELGPNFAHRDAALYNIGFITSQQKKLQIDQNRERFCTLNRTATNLDDASKYKYTDFADAINAYQGIVDNYKDSAYYDEALYRMGVLNYYLATDSDQPAKYYALAINEFNEIIDKPNSKFKYEAMYQRGWLRLNSAEEEDLKLAMGDFLSLLNAIEAKQITDPVLIKDYRDDSVDNIAYCLIALDGLDFSSQAKGVAQLQQVFGNYSNTEVIKAVVDQAAKKKFSLDASMQAVDYMWLKINLAPLALENPSLLDSILVVSERDAKQLREGQDISEVRQNIYLNLINNYGKDSAWYSANKDGNIAPQLAVVRKAYEERSKRLKNAFIADPTEANLQAYHDHMAKYGQYTQLFANDLDAWKRSSEKENLILSTMLAESSKQPVDYLAAINNIKAFNDKYPDDEDLFQHEGLAYTYGNEIYNLLKDRYAEPGFTPGAGLPATEDSLFSCLNACTQRFIGVLTSERFRTPEHEQQAVAILLTLGDTQYDREKYTQATELYLKALEQQALIPDRSKFDIYGKLAMMAETNKDFTKSEQYYRSALQFAQTPQEREAINSSIYNQIQNSYTYAETAQDGKTPDFDRAAAERLRLAEQLPKTDVGRIQGLKWAAHQSYVNAKEYQKAIDLVLELAANKTDIEEVYAYYYRASEIAGADSLMGNKELGSSIKQSFIAKYPDSNRAYQLRLADIAEMQKDPAKQNQVAEAYLKLHDEARNKAINVGTDPVDALMVNAAISYRNAGNKDKEIEVYKNFITIYPKHPNVIPYMEYIADDYRAKGDTLRFEQLAKDIYMKDKTKSDRYKYVAELKLHNLWTGFDMGWKNKDYAAAFKARDEFKKLEAAYNKEGLTFDTKTTYEAFVAAQKEYDDIQKKLAFLKNFDAQLNAIEKGAVLTSSPSQLITVNANTKWETHLVAGSYRRIPNFKALVNAEVAKVNKLLEQANNSGFDIDNTRRLRAYNLIARIYERGADVISTQIGVYLKTSVEAAGYRQQYPGDGLAALISQVAGQQNNDLLSMAATTHLNILDRYAMAGYKDQYTQRSEDKLRSWQLLPDYKVDEYLLNAGWNQKIGTEPGRLTPETITSPAGVNLGSVTIPAKSDLTLTRMIPLKIKPDFSLVQVVYPYDLELKFNGTKLDASAVPTDTLVTGKPITTRYAYWIPDSAWGDGQNIVEIKAPNQSSDPQTLDFNLQVFTDKKRIAESVPTETVMLYSGTSWKVVQTNLDTNTETSSPAIDATNFGITPAQIDNFSYSAAKPIWLTEEAPVTTAVFETEFVIDTEYREGKIELVAPESAKIMVNGTPVEGSYEFDYDTDPFMVYPVTITIGKDLVKQGKNTLRFEVTNNSAYRGFLAAVTIVKAGKEELR